MEGFSACTIQRLKEYCTLQMKGQIKGLVVYDLSMQIVVETFYTARLNASWRSSVFSYFLFIKTQTH